MTDQLPPALREALDAPFKSEILEHDADTWRGTGRFADCPPDCEQKADRASAMAAALRWAKSMYAAFNSDDADGVLERNIAVLEQESEGT